jgi:hypothetical protein
MTTTAGRRQYLVEKVQPVIKPLLAQALKTQPADFSQWLSLRLRGQPVPPEANPGKRLSPKAYLESMVTPVLEPLLAKAVNASPADLELWCELQV